ncbi:hypothetical protein FHR70_003986 [Microvirga lupini]|uniref:Uncharacterized protein n=1 Tax=Microvirga lupini TaxID=420324 RepID=A0A7W4VPE5_9HYPH|nr:hypothetical protein [Microvirga lupini]MBB3020898.1 hypothetical protein [Microvirga lupini]
MADTPKLRTYADHEARLIQASLEAVERSRALLEQTKPLVRLIEGGCVIGARVPNLGDGDPAEDVQQQPDG